MKTTSKRVISLLLAIMMVLSIFTIVPLTASAETTSTTETAGTSTVTAKALYKSHKIEWSYTGTEETSAFTITKDGTDITSTITSVDVSGTRYYTALVDVGTGVNSGATYTVKKGDAVIGTDTVDDATSREALIKNALVTKDYRSTTEGYKTFGSGVKAENLNVSADTLAKIKSLNGGSIIFSAKTTDTATGLQPVIALSNSLARSSGVYIGIRDANKFGFRFNSTWLASFNCYLFGSDIRSFAVSVTSGGGVRTAGDGANSWNNWTNNKNGSLFVPSVSDITGVSIGGPVGTDVDSTFKGNIYYAIISEEIYTNEELATLTKDDLTNLTGKSSGTYSTLTWDGTTDTGWTIKADGVDVTTSAEITCTGNVVTAVVPVTLAQDIVYTVESSALTGTVTVTYVEPEVKVEAPTDFTAKALYRSHKIEWSTTNYKNAVFKLYKGTEELSVKPEIVDISGKTYYTVILDVATGTGKDTEYTLKGNIADDKFPTAKVADNTGFEALRKNALFVVDYTKTEELGYKSFDGTADAKVNVNVTELQAYKLSRLTAGAIFTFAYYNNTTTAQQTIISFSNNTSQKSWVGVRQSHYGGEINGWLKGVTKTTNDGATPVSTGAHLAAGYYSGLEDSKNWGFGVDGTVYGGNQPHTSFMNWNDTTDTNSGITKDSIYVGATDTGADPFTGNVYYVIVSEEKYTSAEISAITGDTPYNRLSSLLETTKAKYISTGGNYKNDEAYRKLENALTTYSAYTVTTEVAKIEAAIEDINNLASKVTERTTELAVVAIDKTILSENADDNSHAANGGNDGDAKFLFDNNDATMWHSYYSSGGGNGLRPYSDTESVNATHPIWMQTGFGGTEYITKIECKPRTDNGTSNLTNQVKTYEVYVSNNETKPFANVSVSETDDWTLVKSGTLEAITSDNTSKSQVITFTQPVEAKWIRFVVTSTTGTYSCIANMNIYKATDTTTADIAIQVNDKIAEAKALLNSATVVNNEAYATYTAALAEINAKDLTTEATQDDLKTLNDAIAALSFTTTNADGAEVTYTGAAQQTIDSIDEKIEEAKHIIMQAGVVDTTELEEQITALEALTVTTSVDELTSKLKALQTQIDTAKKNEKTVNKADTLASDSVKWNNTATRLETLKNNVKTNVEREKDAVKYIFDGDYLLNDSTTTKHYGSWRENTSEQQVPWISIKLGESVCVSGLVIFDRLDANGDGTTSQNYFKNYEVWVSNDADFNNYVIATSGTRTNATYSTSGYEVKFDQPYDCQYIKFVTYGDVDCKIVEMDIYEYVGAKVAKAIKVTTSKTDSIAEGFDLGTISLNKKFTDEFSKEELEKRILEDINISDIAHNYVISVNATTLELSVAASDTEYTLTVNNNGDVITKAETVKYGKNFNYTVDNAKGWKIDDKVVCDGNTFNYKATDDMTATAIFDKSEVVQSVSAYIPTPVISYNGTKTTVQIPVYINGTTDYKDKGIVFVKSGTSEDDIKSAILGTEESSYVKIFSAGDNDALTLTNKGRYLHTLKISGKLPAGDFYAYVVTIVNGEKTVTLSNVQSR